MCKKANDHRNGIKLIVLTSPMYLIVAKSLSPTRIRAPTSKSLTSTRFVMMLQQCEQRPTMLDDSFQLIFLSSSLFSVFRNQTEKHQSSCLCVACCLVDFLSARVILFHLRLIRYQFMVSFEL